NRHVAKRLVRKIPGDVRKIPRRKPRVAVRQLGLDRWLALNFVGEVGIAEGDVHIVVAMAMHQRRGMRRDLDLESAYIFVFDGQVVRRFSGNLNFRRGLRSLKWNQQEEKQ